MRVRLASDLAKGDEVRTPTGRLALVRHIEAGAITVQTYDGDELDLRPDLLTLMRKAPPRAFPKKFFGDAAVTAGRMPL